MKKQLNVEKLIMRYIGGMKREENKQLVIKGLLKRDFSGKQRMINIYQSIKRKDLECKDKE